MNWKSKLIQQFPGLDIKDTELEGIFGPLYLVTYAGGTNVVEKNGIADWCKDIERSNNWIPNLSNK